MEFLMHNTHILTAGMVGLFLILTGALANRKLRNVQANLVPADNPGAASIFEVVTEGALGLMEATMGDRAAQFLPLIGTLFLYIFVCNFIGLIPGLVPPTENINTNAACALVVFLYYNYQGVKTHGFTNYMKHFLGPVIWLGPLMLVIELISHAVRPVSLSVRLFGNITGDHMVLEVFTDLTKLFIPVIFLGLGLFVSFIQAFVFSLLSMIYIALATEHDH